MTVTYAILSAFPEWAGVGELVESFVFENFVPDVSASVTEKLAEFSDQARQLGVVGGVIVLFTAFWTLITIEKAFNLIWPAEFKDFGYIQLLCEDVAMHKKSNKPKKISCVLFHHLEIHWKEFLTQKFNIQPLMSSSLQYTIEQIVAIYIDRCSHFLAP